MSTSPQCSLSLSRRIDPFPLDPVPDAAPRPSSSVAPAGRPHASHHPPDGGDRLGDTAPPASLTLASGPTQDSRSEPSPDLSRSPSARGASRLSSSFFPALVKARLALSSSSSAAASATSSTTDREMRSSRAREPPPKPRPLLILKLSGSSFLDTIIRDDKTKDPLYILETTRELTNIYRLDHPRDEPVRAATVQWPLHPVRIKGKSGRTIQFGNGSWREAEDLLKAGPLGSTAIRKFNIPHYPNSLKWKLIPGNCFCCVTNAVKGPVAVLDAATLSAPPRLKVYHPLIERDVARSQDNYKGVPTAFLDYLIVTSLLLVTDVQEWLDRPREARIPGSSSYTVQRWLALIHNTPAPPEPQHPTVDLSLTVPSTPPQSATFPSPGGYWETQSGVTSLSGSNGSGSGASYTGEPFTPTTPATPGTPATSANSSAFFSRSTDDPPPVPPVPGSSAGVSSAEPTRMRERPKSNPQAMTHSANSSTSTTHSPAMSHPYSHAADGEADASSPTGSRQGHSLSLPGGTTAALSTSAPTSPLPLSASSSTSSSRLSRRQLPVPPGPVPANSFAQPWLYGSNPVSSSGPLPSASASPPVASSSTPPSGVANPHSAARAARASMRGSLRTIPIPPPPPPPQHSIPLPPKLAQEQQGYVSRVGPRPRTAPETENGDRRRHSESYAPGQFGDLSPVDDSATGVHPYASAANTSFSLRGRDMSDLVGRMEGLSASPGPSSISRVSSRNQLRGPGQPAPDYDTHSFVNMPPLTPLPVPPVSSSGTGSRPPQRRQLTVVNADVPPPSDGPPGLGVGPRPGTSAGLSACPPTGGEYHLNPRISYADSVYEMPPPAYDAIDFSVRFVPAAPQNSSQFAVVPVASPTPGPLPLLVSAAETGRDGHRAS